MRVLIADQESEMLETVARFFEVDIATSKTTCIDLMRANPFDVLIASERLSDGSGLELLSHVATRWPDTLRVLVIEPARLKLLRGKLGPFKLHATMKYPIEDDELEAVLIRMQEILDAPDEDEEEDEPPPPAPPPKAVPTIPAARAQTPAPRQSIPNQHFSRTTSPALRGGQAFAKGASKSAPPPQPVSDPRRGGYTPLGAAEDAKLRIIERDFGETMAPLAQRAVRAREEADRPRTSADKAKGIADQLSQTLKRFLKR
jgi:hypothetical protein